MISVPFAQDLAVSATKRQRSSHRPGTNKGRESAVRLFLAFCKRINLHFKNVRYFHICWYIEYLTRHNNNPASISNAISHLRTFYTMSSLSTRHLYHARVQLALRAIAITIRPPQTPRDPVTPSILKDALSNISCLDNPDLVQLAVLLMYLCFLRQSNIAPQSVKSFDPTRHLTAGDLTIEDIGLRVKVKWSKTIQSSADATSVVLPVTRDPVVCPVRAYDKYLKSAPPPGSQDAPLLRYKDGNAMTVPHVRKQWARLLSFIGKTPKALSLHSLRRGAAQYTYNTGKAKLNDVMNQGTWRSQSVRAFIRPDSAKLNSVYTALRRM